MHVFLRPGISVADVIPASKYTGLSHAPKQRVDGKTVFPLAEPSNFDHTCGLCLCVTSTKCHLWNQAILPGPLPAISERVPSQLC